MSAEGGDNERQLKGVSLEPDKENDEDEEEGILPALCEVAVVFAHLRSYLPNDPKHQRVQRRICRAWYINTLRQWRARNVVNVCLIPELVEMAIVPRMELKATPCLTVQEFVEHFTRHGDLYDLRSVPILHMNVLGIGITLDDPLFRRFWGWSAPTLKSLTLHRVSVDEVDPLNKILFQLTPNLEELTLSKCMFSEVVSPEEEESPEWAEYTAPEHPNTNMKSLTIMRNIMSDYEGDFPMPMNWLRLFSYYPNLQKLHMEDVLDDCDVIKIFNAIDIIKMARGSEVLNITKLSTRFVECNQPAKKPICSQLTLHKINHFNFPLTHVELSCSGIPSTAVVKFLKPHRATLKTLILTRDKSVDNYDSLPHHMLPRDLTKFALVGRMFAHWDFLRYMKKMECLEVDMKDAALLTRAFEKNLVYVMEEKRRKLQRLFWRTLLPLHVETFRLMLYMMPGLTDLSVAVETDGFSVLCDGWKKLKRLEIQKPMMDEDHFIRNIIKLEELTELVIAYNEGCTYPKFGDKAIRQGILVLPKLKKLKATFSQVSCATIAALSDKFSDMKNIIFL